MIETEQRLYARALEAFRLKFMPAHRGVIFNREQIYQFFGIKATTENTTYKRAIGDVLYNLSKVNKEPELEQISKSSYRIIDDKIREIPWWDAKAGDKLNIRYPYGVEDATEFGFEESIILYPGDMICLAGEGNRGKTAFALNFLFNNMNKFKESILFTSEFNPPKFRDRISHFTWVNLMDENGKPKFKVAKQEENFQDVIIPDALNIIDWINLTDEPWKISDIMDKIQNKLGNGLALVVLQKRSYKTYAVGGEASKDYASAYFTISYDKEQQSNILFVEKVKTPGEKNPNFKKFSFKIVNQGSMFHDIREE